MLLALSTRLLRSLDGASESALEGGTNLVFKERDRLMHALLGGVLAV